MEGMIYQCYSDLFASHVLPPYKLKEKESAVAPVFLSKIRHAILSAALDAEPTSSTRDLAEDLVIPGGSFNKITNLSLSTRSLAKIFTISQCDDENPNFVRKLPHRFCRRCARSRKISTSLPRD
ncbi:hypothetical protein KIN20_008094 [Parelaphostrongylus tenuis]|uniref:Uncharacterized protein n=1 Tax=Parelaphostrongylus tenuis TaxID=148309 RepID=A0AAD5M491_PARTN|nr:hypothetical protein KIN20_008094 [Parelaphostrongylus tenuis]